MKKKLFTVFSYILVAVAAASLTFSLCTQGREKYSKLDELKRIIDLRFVEDVDTATLEDGAAAGMVAALGDRWSYYLTRDEYVQYLEQMNNSYVGVGMIVQMSEEGYVHVLRVTRTGPAEEAGLLAGDLITHVDGGSVLGLDINQVKNLVRGEAGSTVELTVKRGEQTLVLNVERRVVNTPVAEAQMLENNIGLITIANFDSRCAAETVIAIESLRAQGAKALIFDVRYNPGGYKSELVELLDYLLPEGPLFRSVEGTGKEQVDTSDADFLDMPMAVLINRDSYSAAEFFGAALREYEAAILVGENTTGKGRFQVTYRLADGSAVNISIGTYRTPKGVDLTDVGLTPDIPVPVEEELFYQIYYGQLSPQEDPQIRAAWEAMAEKTS